MESRIRRNVYVRFGGSIRKPVIAIWLGAGRDIRKRNDIAELYADNKVDVIIYAVGKGWIPTNLICFTTSKCLLPGLKPTTWEHAPLTMVVWMKKPPCRKD